MEYKSYGSDGNMMEWKGYEYDSAGNIVMEMSYSSDGSIMNEQEYDVKSREWKTIGYGSKVAFRSVCQEHFLALQSFQEKYCWDEVPSIK